MMEYQGYIGVVEFDDKAKIFHGEVINTRDVITFQGTSVEEIENAFRGSIEDYLEWCKKDGVNPEKPYSGKFNLRLSPELHKEVAVTAKKLKISRAAVDYYLVEKHNLREPSTRTGNPGFPKKMVEDMVECLKKCKKASIVANCYEVSIFTVVKHGRKAKVPILPRGGQIENITKNKTLP